MRVLDAIAGGLALTLGLGAGAAAEVPPPPDPVPLGLCRTRLELKKTGATEWPSIPPGRATLGTDEHVGETMPIDGPPEEEDPEPALVSRDFTWSLQVAAPGGAPPCNVSVTLRHTLDALLIGETPDHGGTVRSELVSPPPGLDAGAVSQYGIFHALILACDASTVAAFNTHCSEEVSSRVTDTHATNEDWSEWSEGLFVETVYVTREALPAPAVR